MGSPCGDPIEVRDDPLLFLPPSSPNEPHLELVFATLMVASHRAARTRSDLE